MAKNYADMSAEELKKLNEEQQMKKAALTELAKSDPRAMTAMTANERGEFMKSQEQARTNAWHKDLADARERRLSSVEQIAARDPGRYSAAQRNAAVGWLKQNESNRRFDEEQKKARTASENEMNGKIDYGKGAAQVKANADVDMNKNEWTARQNIAEQEAAAREYLADKDAETKKYGIEAEHGKIGPDGNVTPGSRERTATITGEAAVRQQAEANKGLAAQAEIARQKQERDIAGKIEQQIVKNGGAVDKTKIAAQTKIIGDAMKSGALNGKDPATVLSELAETYKENPEMLSAIQALTGTTVGQGQPPPLNQQKTDIPGYSPEKIAELQKRGFKWDGTNWVK